MPGKVTNHLGLPKTVQVLALNSRVPENPTALGKLGRLLTLVLGAKYATEHDRSYRTEKHLFLNL